MITFLFDFIKRHAFRLHHTILTIWDSYIDILEPSFYWLPEVTFVSYFIALRVI